MDGTGLLDGSAVLEPPLERIRDCEIPELRRSAENFIRENARCNFVERKHSIREKREDVITIRLILQQSKQSRSRLEISSAFLFNEDRVEHVQSRGLCGCVIGLFVNEHEQRIPKSINLLSRTLEWAGRLRLPNAGNFDVHVQAWKINSLGRTTPRIRVTVQKICLELMFEIRADCLSVGYPKQAWFSVRRFSDGKGPSFLR